ncbi:MAG: zinc-finger domain-containing protein [Alphaproteobacteria bacterium]|nr:zinc-finger domain-containing protein [Alphaproteobacteria bacterium]
MQQEIVETATKDVTCDGNVLHSRHPRIYLNMGNQNEIVCPYCSCKFVWKEIEGSHAKSGH